MSDVLLQTLTWTANPSDSLVDVSGSGGATVLRTITAAEAVDANDTTYQRLHTGGDGVSIDGSATDTIYGAITTAAVAGSISFLRFKWRGKALKSAGTGTFTGHVQPSVNAGAYGSLTALTGSFANYTQDLTTDPVAGGSWTNAKINAKTFGVLIDAVCSSTNFLTAGNTDLSEFSIEVWGPSSFPQTVSPATIGMTMAVLAVSIGLGAVSCSPPTIPMVSGVGESGPPPDYALGGWDPMAVTTQNFSPIRPTTPPELGDATTFTLLQDSWVGFGSIHSGTLAVEATAMQQSLDQGAIDHIEIKTYAGRYNTGAAGTYGTNRIKWTVNSVTANATVTDLTFIDIGSNVIPGAFPIDQFLRTTGPLPLKPNGQPWTWADLNAISSIRVEQDYSAHSFDIFQIGVAEIWIEVFAVNGSVPEVIRKIMPIGKASHPTVIAAVKKTTGVGKVAHAAALSTLNKTQTISPVHQAQAFKATGGS